MYTGAQNRYYSRSGHESAEKLKVDLFLILSADRVDSVYNKLKTRHQRKKISTDVWNKAVALAWEYKEKAEKGEIKYHELEEIYKKM